MKKVPVSILITVLFSCLVFISFYSFFYLTNITYGLYSDGYKSSARKPDYHFVVIAQNTDDPYWQSVKKGCLDAAAKYNAAVEFNGPRFTNIEEEMQYLDIAVACRVDGIATHVLDENRFAPLINKAVGAQIPVITIDNDAKNSKRNSFIGTNSYKFGKEAGDLLVKISKCEARVAIILDSYNSDGENIAQNLMVSGFKDSVKDIPGIGIKTIKTSNMGFFSSEDIARDILSDFPDVNTILCTSSKDTIGVAQVIVDLNRVGKINIIGSGDTPEILRYVEKGVICGTVIGDPYKTGFESIKALVEIKERNMTSSYIDTGVKVIDKGNLKEYKNSILKVKEKSTVK